MDFGIALTMGHRQHRNIGFCVVVFAVDRQRPKMRWRPGKNNQNQQKRMTMNFPRHGSPTQQWRRCTRDTANDDILWRSEEHTSELQSRGHLVCRLLLETK